MIVIIAFKVTAMLNSLFSEEISGPWDFLDCMIAIACVKTILAGLYLLSFNYNSGVL